MAHCLPLDPVLLIVEGEGDEVGGVEDVIGGSGGIIAARADEKGDVADSKGSGTVVGTTLTVFSRTEEEEESKEGEVGDVLLDLAADGCSFVEMEE